MIALLKLKECIPNAAAAMKQLSGDEVAFIRCGYATAIPPDGVEPRLAEVVAYALSTEGSLMRAQLGYTVMRCVDAHPEDARRFGIAVELFHTASLLFDDMPSMDNATYRRGRLCLHRKFGEADATLAALALITEAYDLLFATMLGRPAACSVAARGVMHDCLGVRGILSGQAADLHYSAREHAESDVLSIAAGKTSTLLRLLLVFPARLFAVPDGAVGRLEKLAANWGCAYQVLDDIKDSLGSELSTGKTVRRDVILDRPNFLNRAGEQRAWALLLEKLSRSGSTLNELTAEDARWSGLGNLQVALVSRAKDFREQALAAGRAARKG